LAIIEKDARSIIRLSAKDTIVAHNLHNLAEERSMLLDPCQDDPEAFLIFREDGIVVSVPAKTEVSQSSQDIARAGLDRGQVTIDVLGLNRDELVRERQGLAGELKTKMTNWLKILGSGENPEKFQAWLLDQLSDHQPYAAVRRQILGPMVEQAMHLEPLVGKLTFERNIQSRVDQSTAQKTISEDNKDLHAQQLQQRATFTIESAGTGEGEKELFFLKSGLVDEIHVVNYRPISDIHFKFGPGSSELAGWKVLVGENAVGKSSLLEAVAVALMGPARFKEFVKAEKLDPSKLLRRGVKPKQGYVKISFSGDPNPVEMSINEEGVEYADPKAGLRCYLLGFGSARWLPQTGSQAPETDPYVRIRNLFNPFVPLTDAIKWLIVQKDELREQMYRRVEEVLARLLLKKQGTRFRSYKGAVYIVPPGCRVSSRWDRLDELSDGYQTILAIASAIMQMLGERWKYQMEAAEGLVLLDEIGEHLHPIWKLRIVESLRSAFPRMQFLATTHEPLCLRGLYDNEILIMRRVEDRIAVYDDIPSPNTLSIDRLLTSPYFGLLNTFDQATEAEFRRYYEILSKKESMRSPGENIELEDLKKRLDADGLFGTTFPEKLAIQAVNQLLVEKQAAGQKFDPPALKAELKSRIAKMWDKIPSNTG
jgi:hypothetical protein